MEYIVQRDTNCTYPVEVGTPLILRGAPLAVGISSQSLPTPLTVTLREGTGGSMSLDWKNAEGGEWQTVPGFSTINASTADDKRSTMINAGINAIRATSLVADGEIEVSHGTVG